MKPMIQELIIIQTAFENVIFNSQVLVKNWPELQVWHQVICAL